MTAYKIGRLCTKIAGRDAGKVAVIVDVLENKRVLLDGNVRRRAVNKSHILVYDKEIKITKGASHEEVAKAFKKINLPVRETKPKKAAPKPTTQRAKKASAQKQKQAAPTSKKKAPEEKPPQ